MGKYFIFKLGTTIELQCEVSHVIPNATVKWHKGGFLLNKSKDERIRKQIFSLSSRLLKVVGSKLMISPAEYIDAGSYKVHIITVKRQNETMFHEFEGNQVTFACRPEAQDSVAYHWYHENELLHINVGRYLTIPYIMQSDGGNYKCLITPGNQKAAIKSSIYDVYDASKDDTGRYSCEIEYYDMIFKSPELKITVRAKPQLRVLVQGTTLLWEDQSLHLSCDILNLEGPVTYYKWYKNGIIIDGTESRIYHLYDASMDDTGNYSCEIEYSDRVFKSPELEITIKAKPQLHVVVQESTLAWENESLNLSCDVSNLDDPVTYYIWYKDNKIMDIVKLQITVQAKPRLRIIVHEGTVSPWRHKPFHLLCDVENLDDSVWLYKWYKDPNIIDHIESRNYNVSDASMDDTGNYICEIKYLGKVFTSPGLQITVQECDKNVPDSIALFYLIDTHGDSRRYLNRYKNFSFNVAQILTESYNSTVEVRMGMAIFDHHQYKRLMKFGKYERITGLAKKLLEQQIDKMMAFNNSNIHLINMADAIEKSVAEFEEAQTDDQVNTKNILVVQQNSIGCDDCVESLQKNLNVALMRNVDVILVTPTEWLDIFNIIANKILYDQKDGLEGVSRPLLEMIRKLASSSCHNGCTDLLLKDYRDIFTTTKTLRQSPNALLMTRRGVSLNSKSKALIDRAKLAPYLQRPMNQSISNQKVRAKLQWIKFCFHPETRFEALTGSPLALHSTQNKQSSERLKGFLGGTGGVPRLANVTLGVTITTMAPQNWLGSEPMD
uniref:Ig-like domain-containing protein n=1 Tax=Romanomermis culicivorax TaxID=13658 RepID=A0A915KQ14_ROMCU